MSLADDFASASARDPDDLSGDYAVHLVGSFLPFPIRFFGHRKVFERSPDGVTGYNAFPGGLLKTGRFHVERGESADGSDVTKIVYDSPANPFFMRPLTDEVRETAPGTFLGRGMYRFGQTARNVFWFTVTKE